MRKWFCAILLASVVSPFIGCQSPGSSPANASDTEAQAQVRTRLEQIFNAAAKKDLDRLASYHLYGPRFSKFAPDSQNRLDAEAARNGENNAFSRINDFSARADDLKVDVFGNTAIATFVMSYGFKLETNSVNRQALTTLVFVRDRGEWKITHEHISPPKP
jgi:ketosteroid isomerase-like protein